MEAWAQAIAAFERIGGGWAIIGGAALGGGSCLLFPPANDRGAVARVLFAWGISAGIVVLWRQTEPWRSRRRYDRKIAERLIDAHPDEIEILRTLLTESSGALPLKSDHPSVAALTRDGLLEPLSGGWLDGRATKYRIRPRVRRLVASRCVGRADP